MMFFDAASVDIAVADADGFADLILDHMPQLLQRDFGRAYRAVSNQAVDFEIGAGVGARASLVTLFDERHAAASDRVRCYDLSCFSAKYESNLRGESDWDVQICRVSVPRIRLGLDWFDLIADGSTDDDFDSEGFYLRVRQLLAEGSPCQIGYSAVYLKNLGYGYLSAYLRTAGGKSPWIGGPGQAALSERTAAVAYLQANAHRWDPRTFVSLQRFGDWRDRCWSVSHRYSLHPWGQWLRSLPDTNEMLRSAAAFHEHMLRRDGDRFLSALATLGALPATH